VWPLPIPPLGGSSPECQPLATHPQTAARICAGRAASSSLPTPPATLRWSFQGTENCHGTFPIKMYQDLFSSPCNGTCAVNPDCSNVQAVFVLAPAPTARLPLDTILVQGATRFTLLFLQPPPANFSAPLSPWHLPASPIPAQFQANRQISRIPSPSQPPCA